MPSTGTIHEQNFWGAFELAQVVILWVAILLLIKGQSDLQSELQQLRAGNGTAGAVVPVSKSSLVPGIAPSTELLGDQLVLGNLTVQGCILWQQPNGVLQNSCTLFSAFNHDCVHGKLEYLHETKETTCLCEPHWLGPLCNRHDCYDRGNFNLQTSTCSCTEEYEDWSMCATSYPKPTKCTLDKKNCQGQCINNKCVCTLPGQLGLLCSQCAFPKIDNTLCPTRKSWALRFVNIAEQFGVCGGGYDASSSDILIMRGLNCLTPDCSDFNNAYQVCCNPLAYALYATSLCKNWVSWQYNQADYPSTGTVFNSAYRARYLQIMQNYNPNSNFYNATVPLQQLLKEYYSLIQTEEWPLLTISPLPTRPQYIVVENQYLTIASDRPSSHVVAAMWSESPQSIFLLSTGAYIPSTGAYAELRYIFLYQDATAYCLGKNSTAAMSHLLFGAVAPPSGRNYLMHWVNLEDQPGFVLPVADYCGTYLINDTIPIRYLDNEKPAPKPYMLPVDGTGYYNHMDQGVRLQ